MSKEEQLSGYKDSEKLKNYESWLYGTEDPANHTRYYTYYSLLPSLKGKVILDFPSGLGHKARRAILQGGAKKVIAVDIVFEQIELSKVKDKQAGIKEGQIEYIVHDANIPKALAAVKADICLCVHLFCFAPIK